MNIVSVIRTKADYEMALNRLDALMAEEDNSRDELDELEMLALVIESWEKKIAPVDPPDPIEAIRFHMDQRNLTAADVAPYFGGRNRVYEVLSGKRDLTLGMIRALYAHLGIPADILLGRPGAVLPDADEQDWDRFPLQEMIRRAWLPAARNSKDKTEELLRGFLTAAFGTASARAAAAFRRGARQNPLAAPHALTAWCAQAMKLAGEDRPLDASFDSDASGGPNLLREIALLSAEPDGPLRAAARLRDRGIRFIVLRHLKQTYLDGAAMRGPDGAPLVVLSLRHDRLDNFWFCLLHELAHVQLHLGDGAGNGRSPVYIDDMTLMRVTDRENGDEMKREREADNAAGEALIPSELWQRTTPRRATVLDVVELARKAGVHPSIVAGRIRFELGDYRRLGQLVGNSLVRPLFPRDGVYPAAASG